MEIACCLCGGFGIEDSFKFFTGLLIGLSVVIMADKLKQQGIYI